MYNLNQQHNHTQIQEKIQISNETRLYIIDELVEPYYKRIVKNTIDGRLFWRRTGITLETVSKIMVAFGSIISFSAGYYKDDRLSFISGSISCLSLAFLQLSSFSYKENKKQSDELNILLKKLDLDTVPVFERNSDTVQQSKTSMYNMPIPIPPAPSTPSTPNYLQPIKSVEIQKEKNREEENQDTQLPKIQTNEENDQKNNEENNQEDNHDEHYKNSKSFLHFLRNFKI
jgi:hypothetical protein